MQNLGSKMVYGPNFHVLNAGKIKLRKFKSRKIIDCLCGILARMAENEPKIWGIRKLRCIKLRFFCIL
jgi:hypothetical protein